MDPNEPIYDPQCTKCGVGEEKLTYCDKCKYDANCLNCGHCDGCEHVKNGGLRGDQ